MKQPPTQVTMVGLRECRLAETPLWTHSIGDFPDMLSQRIVVWRFLSTEAGHRPLIAPCNQGPRASRAPRRAFHDALHLWKTIIIRRISGKTLTRF